MTYTLTGQPQICTSDSVASCSKAPQGTVPCLPSCSRSTPQMSGLTLSSRMAAIAGCISRYQRAEYRGVADMFEEWRKLNHLQLNITVEKELVLDFSRGKSPQSPCHHQRYRCRGGWGTNTGSTIPLTPFMSFWINTVAPLAIEWYHHRAPPKHHRRPPPSPSSHRSVQLLSHCWILTRITDYETYEKWEADRAGRQLQGRLRQRGPWAQQTPEGCCKRGEKEKGGWRSGGK